MAHCAFSVHPRRLLCRPLYHFSADGDRTNTNTYVRVESIVSLAILDTISVDGLGWRKQQMDRLI